MPLSEHAFIAEFQALTPEIDGAAIVRPPRLGPALTNDELRMRCARDLLEIGYDPAGVDLIAPAD